MANIGEVGRLLGDAFEGNARTLLTGIEATDASLEQVIGQLEALQSKSDTSELKALTAHLQHARTLLGATILHMYAAQDDIHGTLQEWGVIDKTGQSGRSSEERQAAQSDGEASIRTTPSDGDRLPGDTTLLPDEPTRLLAQAHDMIFSEQDPASRLEMLTALIDAGDHDLAQFALQVLRAMPDHDPDDPEAPHTEKILAASSLERALLKHAETGSVHEVVTILESMDARTAYNAKLEALKAGYAGPQGEYLTLDVWQFVRQPERPYEIFEYLRAVSEYGLDVFDRRTYAGKVLTDFLAVLPLERQDQIFGSVASAYAQAGNVAQAMRAKERLNDAARHAAACVYIAEALQVQGDEVQAAALLDEATDLLASARLGGLMVEHPEYVEDKVRGIETQVARLYAKAGNVERAKQLLDELERLRSDEQAEVYADIYRVTNESAARTNALAGLRATLRYPEKAAEIMGTIAAADKASGRVMPSLVAEGESVPLICWEVHELFRRRTTKEVREDGPKLTALKEAFGATPEEYAMRQAETRDRVLAGFAELLAAGDAPKTAVSLLDSIETPAEKVRALAVVSRALAQRDSFPNA